MIIIWHSTENIRIFVLHGMCTGVAICPPQCWYPIHSLLKTSHHLDDDHDLLLPQADSLICACTLAQSVQHLYTPMRNPL